MHASSSGAPLTPDYVRVGQRVLFITWPRLISAALLAALAVIALSAFAELNDIGAGNALLLTPALHDAGGEADASRALRAGAGAGVAAAAPGAGKRGGLVGLLSRGLASAVSRGGAARLAAPLPMPAFCTARSSTYYLEMWRLSFFGASGDYPVQPPAVATATPAGDGDEAAVAAAAAAAAAATAGVRPVSSKAYCDWLDLTATDVPFSLCTFDRTVDTQISLYLHKEGFWNGWKRALLEDLLPRIGSPDVESRLLQGRTTVIDIGANLGFFTLLAATRGYDVIALEPAQETVLRLLFSLEANGVEVARSGLDVAAAFGGAFGVGSSSGGRRPIAFVFQNAASDIYSNMQLEFVRDNPGASWITMPAPAQAPTRPVSSVFLDDLVPVPQPVQKGKVAAAAAKAAAAQRAAKDAAAAAAAAAAVEKVLARGGRGVSEGLARLQKQVAAVGGAAGAAGAALAAAKSAASIAAAAAAAPSAPAAAASTGAGSGAGGLSLDPATVRLIKVSAEGMDSRALNGMRRLLTLGRVPFLVFVYNDAHVRNQGCDPGDMVRTLVAHGYKLWHAGTYFKRAVDITRFVKGMTGRSIELLFVGPDTDWV